MRVCLLALCIYCCRLLWSFIALLCVFGVNTWCAQYWHFPPKDPEKKHWLRGHPNQEICLSLHLSSITQCVLYTRCRSDNCTLFTRVWFRHCSPPPPNRDKFLCLDIFHIFFLHKRNPPPPNNISRKKTSALNTDPGLIILVEVGIP